MYYIWAVIFCIIIFSIIQYIEYQKYKSDGKIYEVFTLNNLIILFIIFILSNIICYFIFSDDNFLSSFIETKDAVNKLDIIDSNTNIDPLILKKIPDNFNTGFEPYDE